ncbi:MAG: hypothetical protein HQM16_08485, partial [Deltaproteobacteria bacterium]|nr:hypothetical protein [Deltaproteobacteria bacterium]
VTLSGQNKVFVNYQRIPLSLLQQLSVFLVDFTGQHEQAKLLEASNDILILDTFLTDRTLIHRYQQTFDEAKGLEQKIVSTKKMARDKAERLEFLKFQLKDFEKLRIKSDEEEQQIKALRDRLKHHDQISAFEKEAALCLAEGRVNCIGSLKKLIESVEKSPALSNIYKPLLKQLDEARILIEDLSYEIARTSLANTCNADLNLEEVEGRLYQLEILKRKYGPDLSAVLKKYDAIKNEISGIEGADCSLDQLLARLCDVMVRLKKYAVLLSAARHQTKQALEKNVKDELTSLLMPGVQFDVAIKTNTDAQLDDLVHYSENGIDHVTFMLSPNPGLAPRPLAKIASGGETSRIFLALKKVLSQRRKGGTLIFDEIDAGISGAAVELVGNKLKDLSKSFQVFCVTHHAQIASLADQHYVVHKQQSQNKTITRVKILSDDDRVKEVARLMGGVTISQKNLAYAAEMVGKKKVH